MKSIRENPYRLFFPIAALGLITGLSTMIFPLNAYGLRWHKEWIIGLFLIPVTIGFLFTAGPRFYVSFPVTRPEIIGEFVILMGMIVSAVLELELAFAILKLGAILLLAVFLFLRVLNRTSGFPIFSSFIFMSFLLGILGSVAQVLALSDFSSESKGILGKASLSAIGSSCYYSGMFQLLIYGAGIRFFPMITMAARKSGGKYATMVSSSPVFWGVIALSLGITFVLEGTGFIEVALWIRALLVLYIGIEGWLVLKFRKTARGVYPFFLRLVLLTVMVGHIIYALSPDTRTQWYHITFIGVFAMGVLMVAGHVTIAHEKLDLSMRMSSKWIAIAFGLIYFALLTRVTAHLTHSYIMHLQAAASIALTGVILFILKVGIELVRKRRAH